MLITLRYFKRTLRGLALSVLLLAGGCVHEAAPTSTQTETLIPQNPNWQPAVATSVAPVVAGAAAPEAIKQGRRVYASTCARCHGVNMVNTGASTFDLREFPLDQKARFVQSVLHGKGAMPAWEGSVTPEEVEALWAYVSTRQTP